MSGLTTDRATLVAAIEKASRHSVGRVEARLVVFAPATAIRGRVIVPAAGEVVGASAQPGIDRLRVTAGRGLRQGDGNVALLEAHFAEQHHLPPAGKIRIGSIDVGYVGIALSPEYPNLTTTSGESIQGQATRAVVFAPIGLARRIGGVALDRVNDAVVQVRPGSDVAHTTRALRRALATDLPGVAVTVTARRDEPSVRALYDEIASERQLFDVFALLILAGAGFAAFSLTKRVVEAQRRDIGIAMSLGVPRHMIAIRTLLFAVEITVVGVTLGVGTGWVIANWVLSVIRERAPLPFWQTSFQTGVFLRGAVLSLIVPLAASALPVWRAIRVAPVEALLPPHLRPGRHRLTHVVRRVRLPGAITLQTPVRRIVRAPARSALTIMAIAFIMAPLLAAFGATDSTSATIDSGERVLMGRAGDRLIVDLASYQPLDSQLVTTIAGSPLVEHATVGLNTGGYLVRDRRSVGVSLSMVDLASALSAPPSIARLHLHLGGIVISKKAAADLHLRVNDEVIFRHPRRSGTGFRFVDSRLPVTAVHESPYRFVAYMDLRDESIFGLDGIVNTMKVVPRAGVSMPRLQRAVADMPGVASALPAASLSRTMRDLLAVVGDLFVILQIIIASLAFLVAFNASSIAAEERAREHATMFAFGIGIRRVVFMAVAESVLLGIVGVGLGIGFGAAVLHWILNGVFPAAVPDLAVVQSVATSSYLLTVAIGLIAATAAPGLNVRRLRTMNIPGALRYVE